MLNYVIPHLQQKSGIFQEQNHYCSHWIYIQWLQESFQDKQAEFSLGHKLLLVSENVLESWYCMLANWWDNLHIAETRCLLRDNTRVLKLKLNGNFVSSGITFAILSSWLMPQVEAVATPRTVSPSLNHPMELRLALFATFYTPRHRRFWLEQHKILSYLNSSRCPFPGIANFNAYWGPKCCCLVEEQMDNHSPLITLLII